ncbi:MAG TPA: TM1802 family CRISPR-associated protein [Candidatus Competibacteraceae bacterium]|nr:TM1802 family CRISPR-associated protein [Candidatus Competibacteraceae bacterium]
MLETMRELALLELNHRCGETNLSLDEIRTRHGEHLTPLLVEDSEKIPRVYLLQAVPEQPGVVKMWMEDLDAAKAGRLPFVMSRVAAIGPVMKRTYKKADGTTGPTLNTQLLTEKSFAERGQDQSSWGIYFKEIHEILFRSHTLIFSGKSHLVGDGQTDPHVLSAAIRLIPEKKTVFLSVLDSARRWPGDCPEYHAYLAQTLADKYITGAAAKYSPADCPLCGATGVMLYPRLRGTGINFSNIDRAGAFPALDPGQAWKSFGLCLDCADSLYIFKNHLLDQFLGNVAGDKALLIPSLLGNLDGKCQFLEDWRKYLKDLEGGKIASHENDLLEFAQGRNDAQVVLHILWATFGQVVDEVRGVVNDILPSRLRQLAKYNQQANGWNHALAPRYPIDDARFDLGLNLLLALLKRPGGRKAAKVNDSSRLFTVKRQLVEAIYRGSLLGATQIGLWREILTTALWYLDDIAETDNAWALLHEGYSEKGGKQTRYWTLAGWVRHLARIFYYLDLTGVLSMESTTEPFEPMLPALKPYFQPGSGLNSPEKAFTFILGILYGKVLQVQAVRGVNVASNALTWLKRLNLDGRDLPELYNKVREKLLTYETEANADVRALIQDLGRLGARLGDDIHLDNTTTCYFLLLGQSVMVNVLPSSKTKKED